MARDMRPPYPPPHLGRNALVAGLMRGRALAGHHGLACACGPQLAAEGDLGGAELVMDSVVCLGEEGHQRLLRRLAQHLRSRPSIKTKQRGDESGLMRNAEIMRRKV